MSTTATKRSLAEAMAEAAAFRDLFSPDTYERWEFAGSLRRCRPQVGDIEHVIIPRRGITPGVGTLFGDEVNLLFHRLDELIEQTPHVVSKHVYGETGNRWGDRYRGVDFVGASGMLHELFCADSRNWGSVLAIRTGPAEQNPKLMSALLARGLRHKNGSVWTTVECQCNGLVGTGRACRQCDGTRLRLRSIVPTPDEQTLFELAGMRYFEPRRRG